MGEPRVPPLNPPLGQQMFERWAWMAKTVATDNINKIDQLLSLDK